MKKLKLRLFFSWQISSDTKNQHNKSFILACINAAVNKVPRTGDLKDVEIEVQEGTTNVPGSPDVVAKCFERIDNCHIYMADLTIEKHYNFLQRVLNIGSELRESPNSNVLTELSRACCRPTGRDTIITVLNTKNGSPNEDENKFPIDIRQYRWSVEFCLKSDKKDSAYQKAHDDLTNSLVEPIRLAATKAIERIDEYFRPFINCRDAKNESGFKTDYKWENGREQIRDAILKNKGVIRLLGISGLGKTRLVLESLLQEEATEHKLYCDLATQDFQRVYDTTARIFEEYECAILVLDNCDSDSFEKIVELRSRKKAQNPIVAIYNNPNEKTDPLTCDVYNLNESDEIVEHILSRYAKFYKPEQKPKIIEFSYGNPLIAELLIEGLRKKGELGEITNHKLVTKLLGADEDSENRKIAQTLSLFRSLGVEGDVREEMVFVATNENITSIEGSAENKKNKFDTLIADYKKRKLLEQHGRCVTMRPIPIAWYLMCEWLEDCSVDRLKEVLESIRTSRLSATLAPSFGGQFKDMAMNGKTVALLNEILRAGSPFSNAEVINTEVGSRLFRSFVEVAPQAVANCLYQTLSNKSIDELRNLKEGRRNLVWTIEKLCFDPTTFEKGAKLMLMLGCAENEEISNNASGQFATIFPLYLPATAASLKDRLDFLKREYRIEEQKELVLKAIDRALCTWNFTYFNGAEVQGAKVLENYQPKSRDEVEEYLKGCLELVYDEIERDSKYKEFCIKAICNNFRALSAFGMYRIVMPYVKKVASLLDYEWEDMNRNLHYARNDSQIAYCEEIKEEISDLIGKLTKETFEARFAQVEKRYDVDFKNHDFDAEFKKTNEKYEVLAVEMAEKKLFTLNILKSIYNCETFQAQAFGRKLATLLTEEEQLEFIKNSLEVIPERRTNIYVDFISSIGESVFEKAFKLTEECGKFYLLFPMVAIRDYNFEGKYVDRLFELVESGRADISCFVSFWNNTKFDDLKKDEAVDFLSRLMSVPGSYETVLHMVSMQYMGRNTNREKVDEIFVKAAIDNISKMRELMRNPHYTQVLCSLLSDGSRVNLAEAVVQGIIEYIVADENVSINYNVEEVLTVLLEKYFDVTWKILSESIYTDEGVFFKFYWVFGGLSIYNNFPTLIFTKEHEDVLLEGCKRYPDVAPYRLMAFAPLSGKSGFSDMVIKILDEYGNKPRVLTALSDKLGSFGSVGSAVPIYEARIAMVKTLVNHHLPEVSNWAQLQIGRLENDLNQTKTFEAEMSIPERLPIWGNGNVVQNDSNITSKEEN